MSNSVERRNSLQMDVYSIEVDCNPNKNHNERPMGDDGTHTEIVSWPPNRTIEAWTEKNLNGTHGRVHDLWLNGVTALTATHYAIIQWVQSLKGRIHDLWLDGVNAISATHHGTSQWVQSLTDSSWFQHVYGPIIIVLAIASTTICTLLPYHNSILEPEYWFEILIPSFMCYFCVWAPLLLVRVSMLMNLDMMFTWKRYLKLTLGYCFGWGLVFVLLHIVWVQMLGYRHPVPFTGHICMLFAMVPESLLLWFLFPEELRKNNNPIRKQILAYIMLTPLGIVLVMEYSMVTVLFDAIPIELQWCVGCFLPVVKELNIRLVNKLFYMVAGEKKLSATLCGVCYVETAHLFTVMGFLDSKFEPLTEYVIMICDGFPNIWSCIKIIKLYKEGRNMVDEMDKEVQCLVMGGMLGLFVQIAYCSAFVISYVGPNANILGNVFTDLWQFEKVHSLSEKLNNILIFFTIDVVQALMLGLTLYYFCKVKLYDAYLYISRQYGTLICLQISASLCVVRLYYFVCNINRWRFIIFIIS